MYFRGQRKCAHTMHARVPVHNQTDSTGTEADVPLLLALVSWVVLLNVSRERVAVLPAELPSV